ncbi:hypothetical protein EIN_065410 [Entamoeba invadens IP1]|uniref:Uncharacterized protein n=1 Tax=Entamoeba invadens IP1 TaxID=370355 RepID=A0A0A1TVC2_ENTIV|nr:hypothetical protein EIN_065410 [Entamoeba invadens IP1]ELP84276.1 hypothetical protein EIN_065410 [Entamoeba invadens IP1]|eukprot:XP_004183622.1 hypothetical protein EIN_065410 [Entamoeba invadens IP1]
MPLVVKQFAQPKNSRQIKETSMTRKLNELRKDNLVFGILSVLLECGYILDIQKPSKKTTHIHNVKLLKIQDSIGQVVWDRDVVSGSQDVTNVINSFADAITNKGKKTIDFRKDKKKDDIIFALMLDKIANILKSIGYATLRTKGKK